MHQMEVKSWRAGTHTHPTSVAIEIIQLSLHVIDVLPEVTEGTDGLEVAVVAHRDGEIEYIGDEIWGWRASSLVLVNPFRGLAACRFDPGLFLEVDPLRPRVVVRIYPVHL